MSTLADYNPLVQIEIRGLEPFAPRGLIVLVGPNASGKTRLLREIEQYLLEGVNKPYLVLSRLSAGYPKPIDSFIGDLERLRLLVPVQNGYMVKSPHLGRGPGTTNVINRGQLEQSVASFQVEWGGNNPAFFGLLGKCLVTSLFLDNRLGFLDTVKRFSDKSPQENDIHALFESDVAKDLLAQETGSVFGNACFLDITPIDVYILRCSGTKEMPSPGKMNTPNAVTQFRTINLEGDGYKSYVSLCIALLAGVRPVTLIDEPELCLHPPQARAIGRFIGKNVKHDAHVVFVATHNSHVLRGILDTAANPTIIRMTKRSSGEFHGHRIEKDDLLQAVRNPRVRAETILDGIFSRGVILVEAEGDRAVYQAGLDGIENPPVREIHLASMGGTGGFGETCKLYRSLDVPFAIVPDVDILGDTGQLKKPLQMMAASQVEADALNKTFQEASQLLKAQSGNLTVEQMKERLQAIIDASWDWNQDEDNKVRSELESIRKELDRLGRLKREGVEAYSDTPELKEKLDELIEKARAIGIFMVRGGQLENWIPHLMQGVSKLKKAEWAAKAAHKISEATEKKGDIWEFMFGVLTFLASKQ